MKNKETVFPTSERIDKRYLGNMVFVFGEIFVPKKLNFFQKLIIWIKFKLWEHRNRKEAYRHMLETGNRVFKYEDFATLQKSCDATWKSKYEGLV